MTSNQSTAKLPTMAQAVEIIGMQLSRSEQANQLRYMRSTGKGQGCCGRESEGEMNSVLIVLAGVAWVAASAAFAIYVCPRLMRNAPGGNE